MTQFEIYLDKNNEWRYRLRHHNGKILIDSGEGYSRKSDCLEAIRNLKSYVQAPVVKESENAT